MADVLRTVNLQKIYGRKKVVKDVSFEMESGGITGLLGPNGAGKTTSFYMIVGFIKPSGGHIYLNDTELNDKPMHERSKLGLAYLPQEASIFRKLSVEDNIRVILEERYKGRGRKKEREEELEMLLERFGIQRVRKQYGYTLSGGEGRRTEIARAIATKPQFLLLDEPFAGIDPKAVYEIKMIIRQLASDGIGVLLTDHNVRDTLEITMNAHIISEGNIIVSGTKDELLSNQMAREIYFGDDFGRS